MHSQGHLEVHQTSNLLKTKTKHDSAVWQVFLPIRVWQRSHMADVFGSESPQRLTACLAKKALVFHPNPWPSFLLNYTLAAVFKTQAWQTTLDFFSVTLLFVVRDLSVSDSILVNFRYLMTCPQSSVFFGF